ncbi:dihydrofolate reductase family protein [Streptomyces ficellus]|uniref:Dihydrofolate reductase n=1 Tax=Streptomyces ficellus TaxID=1977088 RepID=A0A6I6FPH0_9ACTN|nr:dihydrofolate reductase family protein [Streptomyces ficellus]QGV81269.1 dihydrofolate reductase [Streptomyces ficellus]
MGKIIMSMSVSVDGFMEGPNREIDWHTVDEELHRHFNEELGALGAFVHGRVTYELMADFWPTADADPDASPTVAEFARIWRDKPKYVYSGTLQEAGWNTTVLRRVDPEGVAALKERHPDGLVVGGADLAAAFRRYDLIDEYRVYVHPVLLGRGRRMFHEEDTWTTLRPAGTRTFGNGVVLLRYERA